MTIDWEFSDWFDFDWVTNPEIIDVAMKWIEYKFVGSAKCFLKHLRWSLFERSSDSDPGVIFSMVPICKTLAFIPWEIDEACVRTAVAKIVGYLGQRKLIESLCERHVRLI